MSQDDAHSAGPDASDEPAAAAPFRYVFTPPFADILERLGVSLLASTYQAGRLMAVRSRAGRLSVLLRSFERVMGVAVTPTQLAIGTRNAVWLFRNIPDLAPKMPAGQCDACYLPRQSIITGDIRIHELAFCGPDLWFVNTRFNCLATLSEPYSFVPRWRPPFIKTIAAGDCCHLNGLCIVSGQPRIVSAHGATGELDGWRKTKLNGGVIIDIPSGQIVSQGLCMPHSPRFHNGQLWVLNSGVGELQTVDTATGRRETVIRLPGYARGLAFHGEVAFIALSAIREKREFGGVPVEQHAALPCAIHAVDLRTGRPIGSMTFESGCTEIFDVQAVPMARWPHIIGLQKQAIDDTVVIP